MPVPLELTPPPAFDKSIVPAFQTNFTRIKNAFLKTLGGDFQTGVHIEPHIGLATKNFVISYPVAFVNADSPAVLITPLYNGGNQWLLNVTYSRNFAAVIWSATLGGAAATENLMIRWLAFYP